MKKPTIATVAEHAGVPSARSPAILTATTSARRCRRGCRKSSPRSATRDPGRRATSVSAGAVVSAWRSTPARTPGSSAAHGDRGGAVGPRHRPDALQPRAPRPVRSGAGFAWIRDRRVDGLILAKSQRRERALLKAAIEAQLPTVIIAPTRSPPTCRWCAATTSRPGRPWRHTSRPRPSPDRLRRRSRALDRLEAPAARPARRARGRGIELLRGTSSPAAATPARRAANSRTASSSPTPISPRSSSPTTRSPSASCGWRCSAASACRSSSRCSGSTGCPTARCSIRR